MQQRFPVDWNSPCRSRCWLILRMRVRRRQHRTVDHLLFVKVEEPILARFETRNDWVSGSGRVLGCMLAGRSITASNMSALRTPSKVKPPTFRRLQAFRTPVAARFRSSVDSGPMFFHSRFFFPRCARQVHFTQPTKLPDTTLLGCREIRNDKGPLSPVR
jgi:hypothetical protein